MNSVLQVMIAMYLGTVAINIIISIIQYRADRSPAQRSIFIFWLWTLFSFFANGWLQENDMRIVVISSIGTFFSAFLLGSFFTEMHNIKIPIVKLTFIYLGLLCASYLLSLSGISFTLYAFPAVIACSLPLYYALYIGIKEKRHLLTTVQKIYIGTSLIYTVHLLDWSYFKPRPELITVGFWIAFIILHTLSIITPFMGNEYLLRRRNEKLSDEVKDKAMQLTEAETKLWESNKLASLGRMAGGVAHEINNPMQIIALQANEFLYFGKKGEVPAEQAISGSLKLTEMIQRISKITDSLRRVARDRRTVEKEKNDLAQIINDSLILCANRTTGMDIKIATEIPAAPLNISCNAIEISQVFLNLLNNAIDAVENLQTKQINISVQKTNFFYKILIDDNGKIDPDVVGRMMEPFFTTKPVGKGTGLGLSISKSIVEDHQGNLYVDTSHHTTRFVLELPL